MLEFLLKVRTTKQEQFATLLFPFLSIDSPKTQSPKGGRNRLKNIGSLTNTAILCNQFHLQLKNKLTLMEGTRCYSNKLLISHKKFISLKSSQEPSNVKKQPSHFLHRLNAEYSKAFLHDCCRRLAQDQPVKVDLHNLALGILLDTVAVIVELGKHGWYLTKERWAL